MEKQIYQPEQLSLDFQIPELPSQFQTPQLPLDFQIPLLHPNILLPMQDQPIVQRSNLTPVPTNLNSTNQKPTFYAVKLSISPGGCRFSMIDVTNNFDNVKSGLQSFFSSPHLPIWYGLKDAKIYIINDGILKTLELKPLITYPDIDGEKINLGCNPYDNRNYRQEKDRKKKDGSYFNELSNVKVEIDFSQIPILKGSDKSLISQYLYHYLRIPKIRYGYNDLEDGGFGMGEHEDEISIYDKYDNPYFNNKIIETKKIQNNEIVDDTKLSEVEKQNKAYDDKINNTEVFTFSTIPGIRGTHHIELSRGIVFKLVAVGRMDYEGKIRELSKGDQKFCEDHKICPMDI